MSNCLRVAIVPLHLPVLTKAGTRGIVRPGMVGAACRTGLERLKLCVVTPRHWFLRRQARHWMVRLTSGRATAHDATAFRAWCNRSPAHARIFAQTRLLWDQLAPVLRDPRRRER